MLLFDVGEHLTLTVVLLSDVGERLPLTVVCQSYGHFKLLKLQTGKQVCIFSTNDYKTVSLKPNFSTRFGMLYLTR